MKNTVPEILEGAARTYKERNAKYGASYKSFGAVLRAMYPDKFADAEEAGQFALVFMTLIKLHRYASADPHKDSAHDAMVYAAMLEEMTNDG